MEVVVVCNVQGFTGLPPEIYYILLQIASLRTSIREKSPAIPKCFHRLIENLQMQTLQIALEEWLCLPNLEPLLVTIIFKTTMISKGGLPFSSAYGFLLRLPIRG